jgi:chorismate-pyruvate lyase
MPPAAPQPPAIDLYALVGLFYDDPARLADFEPAERPLSPPFGELLDHQGHMTVTIERFHGEEVDVQVARTHFSSPALSGSDHPVPDQLAMQRPWYAREITLVGQRSQRTVQYGIVRLYPHRFDPLVWAEIESEQTPLGRVLIRHQVLREVELCQLWRVTAGESLARLLRVAPQSLTYGRTARIYCDGEPAIELLEIVAPA